MKAPFCPTALAADAFKASYSAVDEYILDLVGRGMHFELVVHISFTVSIFVSLIYRQIKINLTKNIRSVFWGKK